MSSEADIFVADSDSESHTDDSRARIHSLSRRYRSGQSLFIMSASIKSELRSNPWGRKRKRGASQENIDRYFPVTKVLEISETQKAEHLTSREKLTASSSTIFKGDRSNGQAQEVTPFWDETLRPATKYDENARTRNPQPTARVIDFRDFDSQRRATPEERQLIKRSGVDIGLYAKREIRLTPPTESTTVKVVESFNSLDDQNSIVPYQPDSGTRDVVDQALLGQHCQRSPSVVQPDLVCTPRIDGIPLSPIFTTRHSPLDHLSSARQLKLFEKGQSIDTRCTKHPVEPTERSATQGIGTGKNEAQLLISATHIDVPEQVLHPTALNTQAELASAQRSLAEALRLDDQPAERARSPAEQEAKDIDSIEAHPVVAQATETGQIEAIIGAEVEAESNAHATEASDHEYTTTVVLTTSPIADATQTPPRPNRRISTFAQFESPVETQESYLGFGSPLTFTPLRPSNDTHIGLSSRMDHTIDNIQRYLDASNFDAEQEAKKLMDES